MGIIQSLNISVACAVSIHEACRQKLAFGAYSQSSMPQNKMDNLLNQWGLETE